MSPWRPHSAQNGRRLRVKRGCGPSRSEARFLCNPDQDTLLWSGSEIKESAAGVLSRDRERNGRVQCKMAFPVEKLDLELALKRVKSDLNTARSFIESPLEIELVDADQATWLSQLSEKIAAGYRPHSAVIADIPKGNGAVRPAALLNLEDRVVYAAAVGALLSAINLGLGWSQGKVDFSYRLSESVRRVEWFTNRFDGWSAFRKVSVERIDNGAAHVVLTDITGFYENIDLTVLFSDLRTLGADSDVIQLLQLCLNRWAVVPNRGVPQGLSASDVLAKVYLNPIDQAMADMQVDFIRYVDDIRIFCSDVPACKKALMSLIRSLRRRGLNLQSAKTEIVSAAEAKAIIEGIAPIITDVQKQYRDFLIKTMESINPYMTIEDLDDKVSPDDAPVEVVREVFRQKFIDAPGKFNKTLFHFLINRLRAQSDDYALAYCLEHLATQPQETQSLLDYIGAVGTFPRDFTPIESFLQSPDCMYDYQVYQIFRWLHSLGSPPSVGLITVARLITFDNARAFYLRAVCRLILQTHGSMADLERLEAGYGEVHNELERAQVLVSIKRLEVGRRNAFYGRVSGDGQLCERAIRMVKEQRL